MKFKEESDVRKWLRSIPLKKKELMLKIDFYSELKSGLEVRKARLKNSKPSKSMEKIVNTEFYEAQIVSLRSELDCATLEFERLTEELECIEKTIIDMKYLRKMSWTAIAMQTAYSERQAQRILKKALRKIKEAAQEKGE